MKNILLATALIAAGAVITGCHHHHHDRKVIMPVQTRYVEAGPKYIHKAPPPRPVQPRPGHPIPPPIPPKRH